MVHTEIITHELTHAIAHFWFGGFGSGLELRALSESFADLLGVIGNGWIRNEPVDWTVGDAWRKPDAQGNAVIRRLYDPLNYQSQGLNHRL
jgi:Zn-dependent metalloprotease